MTHIENTPEWKAGVRRGIREAVIDIGMYTMLSALFFWLGWWVANHTLPVARYTKDGRICCIGDCRCVE